jgi:hypothetical protein
VAVATLGFVTHPASRFDDKIALVTGGTSGIGLATARRLLAEGAQVVIAAQDKPGLDAAVEDLGSDRTFPVHCDVASLADLDALTGAVRHRFGRLDVVFANAGVASFESVDAVTEAEFDRVMNINFKGVFFTIQKAVPLMPEHSAIVLSASWTLHRGMTAERGRQRVNVSHPGHAQRHRGRLCSPAIGVHALGEAALPAFGHHAAQWSRVEVGGVHLAGDEEFVNGAQLRRRQSGRGPAARGSGYTHRRSRSSRPPLSAVAVDHISSTLRRDFTARTAPIRSPEVLIGPEPEVRMG